LGTGKRGGYEDEEIYGKNIVKEDIFLVGGGSKPRRGKERVPENLVFAIQLCSRSGNRGGTNGN